MPPIPPHTSTPSSNFQCRKGCYLHRQPTYTAKRDAPPCRGVLGYGAEALLARVARPSWPRGAGPAGCATWPSPQSREEGLSACAACATCSTCSLLRLLMLMVSCAVMRGADAPWASTAAELVQARCPAASPRHSPMHLSRVRACLLGGALFAQLTFRILAMMGSEASWGSWESVAFDATWGSAAGGWTACERTSWR